VLEEHVKKSGWGVRRPERKREERKKPRPKSAKNSGPTPGPEKKIEKKRKKETQQTVFFKSMGAREVSFNARKSDDSASADCQGNRCGAQKLEDQLGIW